MSRTAVVGLVWLAIAGAALTWWFVHRGTQKKMPSPPEREDR